jgi:hypothetical protein
VKLNMLHSLQIKSTVKTMAVRISQKVGRQNDGMSKRVLECR